MAALRARTSSRTASAYLDRFSSDVFGMSLGGVSAGLGRRLFRIGAFIHGDQLDHARDEQTAVDLAQFGEFKFEEQVRRALTVWSSDPAVPRPRLKGRKSRPANEDQ